jgi:hypothetical protein
VGFGDVVGAVMTAVAGDILCRIKYLDAEVEAFTKMQVCKKTAKKGGSVNLLLYCHCCEGSAIRRLLVSGALLHLDENIFVQIFLTCDCCVTISRDILNGFNE